MDPSVLDNAHLDPSQRSRYFSFHSIVWLLFLVQSVLVCTNSRFPILDKAVEPWLSTILVALALVTSCAALGRSIPLQNVLLALMLILVITSGALILANGSGSGPAQLPITAYLIPPLAATVMLTCRGVARFILRPFRELSAYGLWLLAITTVLAVVSFKLWGPHLCQTALGGRPNLFEGVATLAGLSLFIAIAITPTLINKRPGKALLADLDPLLVWAVLTLVVRLK